MGNVKPPADFLIDSAFANNDAAPAITAAPVVLGTPFSRTARALYIGGGGTANVTLTDGTEVSFVGLLAGTVLPVHCTAVSADTTTASNIVALF